ncbi:NACHT, LRR and PYD domains-containing protein 3-like isoform X3 [Vombatus ursinus]|uniref:NACHT, LRR and PYD domains-containing protein 3-like isoform X3 n=1 Tax=Vombatus ursinus TaxID=29139 RepID=UPI000FFD95CF|nr:NACHT, LRR and PYD domains-containing protein 3-like isoform X3 [Vombatus ursinus]
MMESSVCRLARYLEELTAEQLKRFKLALTAWGPQDSQWARIPWGQIEKADRPDLAVLLVTHRGAGGAWQVALQAWEKMGLRQLWELARKDAPPSDVAEAQGLEVLLAPEEVSTRLEGKAGYKEKYRERVQKKFQILEERNARLGEWVYLSHHYTRLLLVRGHASPRSREQELLASGELHGHLREERGRPIELEALFDADTGEGGSAPTTVVLQGVAGIGKTTLARKVLLDWASGTFYPGQFDYALYINCRTVEVAAWRSVAELLSGWLEGTGPGSGVAPVPTMLALPERLLFVLDGFDELLWGAEGQEDGAWVPTGEKQRVDVHLRSLLAKRLLPECSLLITTRPVALEKLQPLLEKPRVAEVLGFRAPERKAYFYKYFPDAGQAGRAWAAVQANEVLFTMCFVPLVCWAVCTGLRQQIERGEALAQTARTTTTIYTAFLSSLLRPDRHGPPRSQPAGLRALCSLAATGLREQKLWFREQDLARHGLDVATVSTFLHMDQVQHEAECEATYSFFHSTFQEFFAALFLVLERTQRLFGSPRLGQLLKGTFSLEADLPLTVRFLFGLSSRERASTLEKMVGARVPRGSQRVLLKWIRAQAAQCPGRAKTLELLYCLFETQEPEFVQRAMGCFREVKVRVRTRMDGLVAAFCLRSSRSTLTVELDGLGSGAAGLGLQERDLTDRETGTYSLKDVCKDFSSGLWVRRSLSELGLGEDALGDSGMRWLCEDLKQPTCPFQSLRTSQTLTRLDLSYNPLEDQGAVSLFRVLEHPSCRLQSLCLKKCHLTEESCESLGSVLGISQTLQWLDLSFNALGDHGMGLLCGGLRQANCQLQTLRLGNCSLTGRSCLDLASVLSPGPKLLWLHLRNNALGDSGLQRLCQGLRAPHCRLRKLNLANCRLTPACGPSISSILSAPNSIEVLLLSGNDLEDMGIQKLCQGLIHPNCKVQELKVQMCGLTWLGCEALASVLRGCPSLRRLDLSDSSLGEEGPKWLCRGLRQPSCRLQRLRLFRCVLSEAARAELAAVARAKPGLEISYQSNSWTGLHHVEC